MFCAPSSARLLPFVASSQSRLAPSCRVVALAKTEALTQSEIPNRQSKMLSHSRPDYTHPASRCLAKNIDLRYQGRIPRSRASGKREEVSYEITSGNPSS